MRHNMTRKKGVIQFILPDLLPSPSLSMSKIYIGVAIGIRIMV